jgi:hypothetical protein
MEKITDLDFQLTFILTPLADIMVVEARNAKICIINYKEE